MNFYSDNSDLQFHLEHPLMQRIVALREREYTQARQFDTAPVDFEDAMDSYRRVLEVLGEICGETIAANAEEVDIEHPHVIDGHVVYAQGTQRNLEALHRAGLGGFHLPRKYDGLNMPLVTYVMANEMVARGDAGFENIWGLQDCAETLNEFASEQIKAKYLPRVSGGETCAMSLTEPDAGSDLQAVMLKATYDESIGKWRLNGVKRFITNGDGDISLVLARSEEGSCDGRGLSMFVYDKRDGGVRVRRIENKMGIIGSPTCELVYTNAPAELVGERRLGLIRYVMSLMNAARLGIGAQSVGLCEAALREAVKYASEREQFGKAIDNFPAVYEMLAEMKARTWGSRALLYETARFVELYKSLTEVGHERELSTEEKADIKTYTRLADSLTPICKLFASENANKVSYDALQIFGGSGFMKDYPIERLVRDARIMNIYEGTSQLQVVAAIRFVTAGSYVAQLADYEAENGASPLLDRLTELRRKYEVAVAHVTSFGDVEFTEFHARRMVEIVGHTIISHLLARQAAQREEYAVPANVYLKLAERETAAALERIMGSTPDELAGYRIEK